MDNETFLAQITDLMDTEENLTMDTKLQDIEEWDSLSRVAYMAFVRQQGVLSVTPVQVGAAETVGDLYHMLVGEKL